MQEYGSVSAGPAGWCSTFSSLKSPKLMHLMGPRQSCRAVPALDGDPHFSPPLPVLSSVCMVA